MLEMIGKALGNPLRVYIYATAKSHTKWVPDKMHLRIMYRYALRKKLNLRSPKGFNEKLQWLKLHDRNPLYTSLVDKLAVKSWVASKIGPEFVLPTFGKWDNANDIDYDSLPEKFVLKTNHDCGGIAICGNRAEFNYENARAVMAVHLKRNYYWGRREWPYKNVTPCVFAEQYLEPDANQGGLSDYKFMCFDGEPCMLFTCTGRAQGDLRVDFFDLDWRHLPFTRHYPNADVTPSPPASLREMIGLAAKLSAGIPFVRVDFYEVGGRPLFGEMTFYPGAGIEEFDPPEWDLKLGEMIDLNGAYETRTETMPDGR